MKIETKQKMKEFYKKRRLEIISGSLIIGGIVIACILKSKKVETQFKIVEVLPEWAEIWEHKCDTEMLLYESGLPVFANDEQTVIYRDALGDQYSIQDAEDDGFKVIERA